MNRAATIALAPLSLVYRAGVAVRSALYRTGVFKTHQVDVPVISVGNITTGGTGKTPLVGWIAKNLAERGRQVCVLTRGYGRANPNDRVLVSAGERIVANVNQSGDEAMMLAWSLLDKAVVVCDADRVAGAKWAAQAFHRDVIVLDDAFQHRRIARDLDLVCIDATNPWGNGLLFPAGILREPVSSLRRADCVVVTRAKPDASLQQQITQTTDAPIFSSTTAIERIYSLESPHSAIDKKDVMKLPFAAFCGIGNPNAFFQQLRDEGFHLSRTEAFRDHHNYSQSDIEGLTKRASDSGAQALITTAKDAVKLQSIRFPLPCYVAEIGIEIFEADKLLEIIERAIQAKSSERNR